MVAGAEKRVLRRARLGDTKNGLRVRLRHVSGETLVGSGRAERARRVVLDVPLQVQEAEQGAERRELARRSAPGKPAAAAVSEKAAEGESVYIGPGPAGMSGVVGEEPLEVPDIAPVSGDRVRGELSFVGQAPQKLAGLRTDAHAAPRLIAAACGSGRNGCGGRPSRQPCARRPGPAGRAPHPIPGTRDSGPWGMLAFTLPSVT